VFVITPMTIIALRNFSTINTRSSAGSGCHWHCRQSFA